MLICNKIIHTFIKHVAATLKYVYSTDTFFLHLVVNHWLYTLSENSMRLY